MTIISPRLYADLVGKPYAEHGRGPDAFDCLGVAMELARRRGLKIPDFITDSAELHRQFAAGGFLAVLPRLDAAEAGCLVLLRSSHAAGVHLATMLDPWNMLHASEDAHQVVKQRLRDTFWHRRVLGFYRLEAKT